MSMMAQALAAAESQRIPDSLVRMGIRRLLSQRSRMMNLRNCEQKQALLTEFIAAADNSHIAEVPEKANEQHYEVPSEFFVHALGPRLKYSCCYWPAGVESLADSEEEALAETARHAQLADGMKILELGCGWGSLSLWMAEKYPNSQILAVSNSKVQRLHIEEQCLLRGITNLSVQTVDMNDFSPDEKFDRVVSVEMFEHMRNHRELMKRISNWLTDEGKLFVHVFVHREQPYLYEDNGPQDWMTRHFFSGGMMPSAGLLLNYQDELMIEQQWNWSGQHYEKTCNAWLHEQDAARETIIPIFEQCYGAKDASCWFQRWRIFFMACAELFAFNDGNEWYVSHYLFAKKTN